MQGDLAEKCLKDVKTKKVSLNLDEDTLKFVDELSEITKSTRTTTVMSLIGWGMTEGINSLEETWKKMRDKGEADEEKLNELLKKIRDFKKRWKIKDKRE